MVLSSVSYRHCSSLPSFKSGLKAAFFTPKYSYSLSYYDCKVYFGQWKVLYKSKLLFYIYSLSFTQSDSSGAVVMITRLFYLFKIKKTLTFNLYFFSLMIELFDCPVSRSILILKIRLKKLQAWYKSRVSSLKIQGRRASRLFCVLPMFPTSKLYSKIMSRNHILLGK